MIEGAAWWHQGEVDIGTVFPDNFPGHPGPATWDNPHLKRHSNLLSRSMTVEWNCCPNDPDYVIDATVFTFDPPLDAGGD